MKIPANKQLNKFNKRNKFMDIMLIIKRKIMESQKN